MHKQAKQVLLARSSRRNAGGSENNRILHGDRECGGSMRQGDRGRDADADSSKERGTRNAYEKRPLSLELKKMDVIINLHRGSPDVKQKNDQRGTGMERRKSEIVRVDRGKIGEGGMNGAVGCGKDKDREGGGKGVKQVEEKDTRISMLARRHLKTRGEKGSEGAQETGEAAMGLDGFSAGCGGWVSSLSTRSLSTRSLSSSSLSSSENVFWRCHSDAGASPPPPYAHVCSRMLTYAHVCSARRHSDADAHDADAQFPTAVRVNQKSSG